MKQHSLKETITGVVTGIRGFIVDSISSEDIHGSTKDEPEPKEEAKEEEETKPTGRGKLRLLLLLLLLNLQNKV